MQRLVAASEPGTGIVTATTRRLARTRWGERVARLGLASYAVFSLIDAILHHDDEKPRANRWRGFLVSRAVRRSFRPRLDRDEMEPRTWKVAVVLGTVGYLGRAGLFALVGGCVLAAALVVYGLYMFVETRYRYV